MHNFRSDIFFDATVEWLFNSLFPPELSYDMTGKLGVHTVVGKAYVSSLPPSFHGLHDRIYVDHAKFKIRNLVDLKVIMKVANGRLCPLE